MSLKKISILFLLFIFGFSSYSQIITTAAGSGTPGYSGDGGLFKNAQFYYPQFLAYDKKDNLYVSDVVNNCIRKVDASTKVITTILNINGVKGFAFDKNEENLYVSSESDYCIYKYNITDHTLKVIAGIPYSQCMYSYCGDSILAVNCELDGPKGLAIDSSGNIYFADWTQIKKVDIATGIITNFAGTGVCNCNGYGDGNLASKSQLSEPQFLVFDSKWNLYVSDIGLNNIRKINAKNNIISTYVGQSITNNTCGYSGDGGQAINAKICAPDGLAIDRDDNIYFTEQVNNVVRKVDTNGIITTIAGNGTQGYSGDCGSPVKAQLHLPYSVIIEPNGSILIADLFNYVFREILNEKPNIITSSTSSVCLNDSLILIDSAQGGIWISNNPNIASVDSKGRAFGQSEGNCIISYNISNGCNTNSSQVSISVLSPPIINSIIGNDTICEGANSFFNCNPPNGIWSSNDTSIALVNNTGYIIARNVGSTFIKYSLTNGVCISADSLNVYVKPLPTKPNILGDTSICANSIVQLKSDIQNTIWNLNNSFIANIDSVTGILTTHLNGTALINCENKNECGSTVSSQSFYIHSLPYFSLGSDTSLCNGQTYLLRPSLPSGNYLWNTGDISSSLTVSVTGLYWLQVSDSGCKRTDSINVSYKPNPRIFLGNDTTLCEGTSLLLDVTNNNATYQWQDGSTQPIYSVTNQGNYSVKVTANGCDTTGKIALDYITKPIVNLGNDTILCLNDNLMLNANFQNCSYLWQDGSTKPTYNVTQAGMYKVDVANICGNISDSINIQYQNCACEFYIPSAFTPNGDSKNDIFKPSYKCFFSNYLFQIFNRWGQTIFSTQNSSEGWDGKLNGLLQPVGTYIWKLTFYDTLLKQNIIKNGTVTLIR